MRFTASLANLVMIMWDTAWLRLMERENIKHFLFLRYVDDVPLVLPTLKKGWFWNGMEFTFTREREIADDEQGESDVHRTTNEITKAMSSMLSFLQFTGENGTMF